MKLQNFQYRRKTCGAKRSLSFTASPGVERVRTPSVYFFGTFFVQAKKVRQCAAPTFAIKKSKITNLSSAKTSPFSCHKIQHENSDIKPKPNITKNQKFPKNTDVLARSRQCGVNACYTRERAIINNRFILPRKHAHLCGINSTTQIQAIHQIPI